MFVQVYPRFTPGLRVIHESELFALLRKTLNGLGIMRLIGKPVLPPPPSLGRPWAAHGPPMGHPWVAHGWPMRRPWAAQGRWRWQNRFPYQAHYPKSVERFAEQGKQLRFMNDTQTWGKPRVHLDKHGKTQT